MHNKKAAENLMSVFPEDVREQLIALEKVNPFPYLIVNDDDEILFSNEAFLMLGELSSEKIRGKKFNELFQNIEEIRDSSTLQIFPREEGRIRGELSVEESKIVQCSLISRKISPAGGNYRVVFVQQAQIKTPLPSGKSISEFYNFLESIGRFGTWEADLDKRVFYGSRLSYELLGMKNTGRKCDLGLVLDHISSKEEREVIEKSLYGLHNADARYEGEFRVKLKKDNDKELRNIRIVCGRESMHKKRILGFFEDISHAKKIERELFRAKSNAEKADRFKSAFLTNLSHEIRTPMNAILGFSELLKPELLSEKQVNDYTSIIRKKANYLLSLIDDIIELSHFETGEVKFNKTEFELFPLLKELYDEFEVQRKKQNKDNIELVLLIPEELRDLKIYSDPGRIHQLLYNLLSNALKFTEKGRVEIGFKESSKHYKFYVSDTGIGLNEDEQKQVFNRFSEKEETLIRHFGGTGLSLTISRLIVEHLGGRIKVRSEPGKGSKFQINLPIEKPPRAQITKADEKEDIRDQDWKDKVILVAEDEDVNYRFLEAILQKTQAKILRATNGKEAIDLCSTISKIDLVLMDIKMPVVNGFEATMEIRRFRPELPIIAQTAFSINEEIEKCRQVGCDDYITKPIDINLLIKKINHQFLK